MIFQQLREFITGEKAAACQLKMEKAAQELRAARSRAHKGIGECGRAVHENVALAVLAKKTENSAALEKAKSVIKLAREKTEMVRLGLAEIEAEQPARQNPSRAASAFSQGAWRQKGRASDKSVQVSDEEVDALIEREMLREIIKAEVAKPKNARR